MDGFPFSDQNSYGKDQERKRKQNRAHARGKERRCEEAYQRAFVSFANIAMCSIPIIVKSLLQFDNLIVPLFILMSIIQYSLEMELRNFNEFT